MSNQELYNYNLSGQYTFDLKTGELLNSLLSSLPKWRTKMQNIDTFRSRRKLDFNFSGSPTSYSLINLHNQLLGSCPTESHGTEVDCLRLIRTTSILGVEWIDWVQRNCYLFKICTRMWTFQT